MKKILIILMTLFVVSCGTSEKTNGEYISEYYDEVKFTMKYEVLNPETVKFPEDSKLYLHMSNTSFTDENNSEWSVYSWIDSQNDYGVIKRTNFSCDVFVKDGIVNVLNLQVF